MNDFQAAILIAAIVTAIWSRHVPHAVMWIAVGGANAVVCDLYYSSGQQYPAAITLAADAMMCIAIDWKATEKWEMRLIRIYQFSAMISAARLWDGVISHDAYLLALELCNYAALALIFVTATLERIGQNDDRYRLGYSWRSYFHSAYSSLRSSRSSPHWRKNR